MRIKTHTNTHMKITLPLILLLLSSSSFASSDNLSALATCTKIRNDVQRLVCFDQAMLSQSLTKNGVIDPRAGDSTAGNSTAGSSTSSNSTTSNQSAIPSATSDSNLSNPVTVITATPTKPISKSATPSTALPTPVAAIAAIAPEIATPSMAQNRSASASEKANAKVNNEADFGMAEKVLRERKAEMQSINAQVSAVQKSIAGNNTITLANNQRWSQTGSRSIRIKVGDTVVISRGAIGSFMMKKQGTSRTIRVKRVN